MPEITFAHADKTTEAEEGDWLYDVVDGCFGVRNESDLFYTDLYRGLSSRDPEFRYDITLSSPNPQSWAGRQGRVTQVLEEVVQPGDAENTEVYLCGGQRMIEDCMERLKEKGFPEEALHHENFL